MAALRRAWVGVALTFVALGTVAQDAETPPPRGGPAAWFVAHAPHRLVDAFLTPDQQGRAWMDAGEPARAAPRFRDPLWKGRAYQAAGDLASAAAAYEKVGTARGAFEAGNALARLERLEPAAAAYTQALTMRPDFPEATFNLTWVQGLIEQDAKQYDDAGGTGGMLGADKIVFDDEAQEAQGEMTALEAQSHGLTDDQLREMWMRRVQTTPADFLKLKFAVQAAGS